MKPTDDEINDRIAAWHDGMGCGMDLHEALGWTRTEYAAWVQGGDEAVPDRALPAWPMSKVTQTSLAQVLAMRLHAGETDKRGEPYVQHLAAVVAILCRRWPNATPAERDAAWLHDALEDTNATPDSLLAAGVSPQAVRIVQALTRPAEMPYRAWIAQLAASGDQSAIRVKLADNEHNSDPARRLPGSDIVERRYLPARQVLEGALLHRGQVPDRSLPPWPMDGERT